MQNSQDRSGEQVGDYRLLRRLGFGAFGDVYQAEDQHSHHPVAVKLLKTSLTRREDLKAFLNEARSFRLHHPHIVPLLDFGLNKHDLPFLVMEYIVGGTLRDRYPKGSKVPLEVVVDLTSQLASALQYAHDQHLVHRDVKPENLLCRSDGTVLLSDFGIVSVAHATSSVNAYENIGGTLPYMAPEQIEGKPRRESDQYALAVVVYEWLAGGRPFQGIVSELIPQHLHRPPPSLLDQVPTLPVAVEQVVFKALSKNPQDRFARVDDFAAALQAASQLTAAPSPTAHLKGRDPFEQVPEPQPKAKDLLSAKRWQSLLKGNTFLTGRPSRRTVLVGGVGLASLVVVGGGLAVVPLLSKLAKGTLFHTFPQDGIVYAVAWSPDGSLLASANDATSVKIWDTISGAYVLTYSGYSSSTTVYAVAWSPDGKHIASGSDDKTVQVWNALTGAKNLTYSRHTSTVYAVAWSPDGKHIASGSDDNTVQVWDATTGRHVFTYAGHTSTVYAVAWSPDGTRLASGSADQMVQVWDATTGRPIYTYTGHSSYVLAVAWSPNSTHLASGGADKTVQVWSPSASGMLIYNKHTDSVEAVAWSPDGQYLASASLDKTVRVWDLSSNGNPYVYPGHTDGVYTVVWSPGGFPWPWSHEGQRLASGGKDMTVRLWQAV